MTQAASVTATFTLQSRLLTVAVTGTGTGTVISTPAGITCGADCTEIYNAGTVVTLSAASAVGSTFTGWSGGGCSGTSSCVVTMNAAVTVTATFDFTSARWPDSGTRFCSDLVNSIACPGGPAEQDGAYTLNVPSYETIGGRVRDPVSGLIWQRIPPMTSITFAGAQTYCDDLVLDGFTDWRLPTHLELVSIVDFGTVGPAFKASAFPSIPSNSFFWTSSERGADPTQVVGINTNYPVSRSLSKTVSTDYLARCVRGTTFPGARTMSGGSVTDARTKLVWQSSVSPVDLSCFGALSYCEALVLDGQSDGRLPNGKELMSILEVSLASPTISPVFTARRRPSSARRLRLPTLPHRATSLILTAGSPTVSERTSRRRGRYAACVADNSNSSDSALARVLCHFATPNV